MNTVVSHSGHATQQPLNHPENDYEALQNTLKLIDAKFEEAVRRGQFGTLCVVAPVPAPCGEHLLYNDSDEGESYSNENLPPVISKFRAFSLGSPQPIGIEYSSAMFSSPLPHAHLSLNGRAVFMEAPVRSPDNFPMSPSRLELAEDQPMSIRLPLQEIPMFGTSGCTPALDRFSLDRSPFTPERIEEPNQEMMSPPALEQVPRFQTPPRTSMHDQSPDSDSPPTPDVPGLPIPGELRQSSRRLLLDPIPRAPMRPATPPARRVYWAAKIEGDKIKIRTQSFAFNSPGKAKKRAKPELPGAPAEA